MPVGGQQRQDEPDRSVIASRRLSFGAVAEQYDRHRPGYPSELVDAVLAYAGAGSGDRALEVGAGTGRATRLFAERGLRITALEPDPGMAAVAVRSLQPAAGIRVELVTSDFESYEAEEHAFKLLFSGTAWHWVSAARRNALARRALVSGGALAPFWNRPVWDDNPLRPVFEAAYSEISSRFDARPSGPMNPVSGPLEIKRAEEWLGEEFRGDEGFADLEAHTYRWQETYTASEYLGVIGTHSDHILLGDEPRELLFTLLADAIERNGGSFVLGYETLLCLARAT